MRENTRFGHDRGYTPIREGTFLCDRRVYIVEVQGDKRHREFAGGLRADLTVAGISQKVKSDETVFQVQL